MATSRRSRYVPQEIEPKWQQAWDERGVMRASDRSRKPKYYNLVMYPYPSGDLHMGHMRNYVIGDLFSRFMAMRGFEVLNPFGWDAFGLPAENAAMEKGTHPDAWTRANIVRAKEQLAMMGILYDWSREVTTCDPDYYRWTQWLFLRFYERGLAYRAMSAVNWCPIDKTVLANEQVVNGRCWRHPDVEVEKRDLEQWFLKITDYADRLLDDLALLKDWPEHVRTMQANWIGRSHGAEVDFPIDGLATRRCVSTRRDRTRFGGRLSWFSRPSTRWWTRSRRLPATKRCAPTSSGRAAKPRSSASRPNTRRQASSPAATRATRSTASACRSGLPITFFTRMAPGPSWRCPATTRATSPSRVSTRCRSSK